MRGSAGLGRAGLGTLCNARIPFPHHTGNRRPRAMPGSHFPSTMGTGDSERHSPVGSWCYGQGLPHLAQQPVPRPEGSKRLPRFPRWALRTCPCPPKLCPAVPSVFWPGPVPGPENRMSPGLGPLATCTWAMPTRFSGTAACSETVLSTPGSWQIHREVSGPSKTTLPVAISGLRLEDRNILGGKRSARKGDCSCQLGRAQSALCPCGLSSW